MGKCILGMSRGLGSRRAQVLTHWEKGTVDHQSRRDDDDGDAFAL